jgi:hypothetical protein
MPHESGKPFASVRALANRHHSGPVIQEGRKLFSNLHNVEKMRV